MSSIDNKKILLSMRERFYRELANRKRISEALLREYIADETLISHTLASQEGFPYYWVDFEEMVAEGDLVSCRGWFRGTHLGTFMGIPPTGNEVNVSIFVTYRFAGGKIVDLWMMMDSEALMQQLGAKLMQDARDG
jgi:predicted ester cyclase